MIASLFLLLVATHFLACSFPSDEPGDIVVGVLGPLVRNRPTADGAILAANEINAAGGIEVEGHRKRIELVVEDSESEPQTAISKALKLINRDRAVAILGVPRTFNAIPVGGIAERYGIPLISTMSTNPETTAGKRYVFRLTFVDSFQGRALADFAFHDLGARRAASLIDEASPYTVYLADVFDQAFRGNGGEIVAFEAFTEDDVEISRQLSRINESGAEILFMPSSPKFVNLHVREARRSGFRGTFLGSDNWSFGINPRDQPEFGGSFFSDLWSPDRADGKTRAFMEAYRNAFGVDPTTSAALSYDAVSLIAEAVRRGGAKPESIRAELATMNSFRGVSGSIAFRGSGDPLRSVFIRKIDENGDVHLFKEIRP